MAAKRKKPLHTLAKRLPNETREEHAVRVKTVKEKKYLSKSKTALKIRARKAVQNMLDGQQTQQALINAGYSPNYATHFEDQILKNTTFQSTFQSILSEAGVTDRALAEKVNALMNAKETKFFADQGVVKDQREVEALSIQNDMTKFAAKLRGHVIDKSVNLNINAEIPLDLKRYGRRK